jgi:hypothetical protein
MQIDLIRCQPVGGAEDSHTCSKVAKASDAASDRCSILRRGRGRSTGWNQP